MIKTIFFDIGGVLINVHIDRTFRFFQNITEYPYYVFQKTMGGEIHDAYERGEISDDTFFQKIKALLPCPDGMTQEVFFEGWTKLIGEPTKTMEFALKLTSNYSVWLASNTNRHHIGFLKKRGMLKGFHGEIYSFDLGLRKPDRQYYSTALTRAGVTPDTTLFVDDRLLNVESAQRIGMKVLRYKDHESFLKEFQHIAGDP